MKRVLSGLLAACLAIVAADSQAAVVINEVYSGGGSSSAAASYTRDFVELYNTSMAAIDISGWQLLYASQNGSFTNTIAVFDPGTLIGASDFFTVVTGSANTGGATLTLAEANLITPVSSASLSATNGSVSLFNSSNVQIDVLGWGAPSATGSGPGGGTFNKFEIAAATAGTISTSMNRTAFVDSGNNLLDFSTAAPSPTAGVAVPEPSSMALLGLVGVAGEIARRRRAAAVKA